jgi:hypothetical protein
MCSDQSKQVNFISGSSFSKSQFPHVSQGPNLQEGLLPIAASGPVW